MTVLPASPAPVEASTASEGGSTTGGWLAALGLISAIGVVFAVWQGYVSLRGGLGIGMVSLLIILAGLFFGPSLVSDASSATQPQPDLPAKADPAYGRALFVAKGCSSCHLHSNVSLSVPGPFIGPNLTNYPNTPEFMRAWLSDPAKLRPETKMPDLNLTEAEMDALIAFLKPDPGS
jgi:cytochrome c2